MENKVILVLAGQLEKRVPLVHREKMVLLERTVLKVNKEKLVLPAQLVQKVSKAQLVLVEQKENGENREKLGLKVSRVTLVARENKVYKVK